MAENQNTETRKKLIDELKLQQNVDRIPSKVREDIQPVITINSDFFINEVFSETADNETQLVCTTLTTKDTYLCGYTLQALDFTGGTVYLEFTLENGKTVQVSKMSYTGINTPSAISVIMPSMPIKLKRGTAINLYSSDSGLTLNGTVFLRLVDVM